jgi:DNA-binding GntR family transcriptional regulator
MQTVAARIYSAVKEHIIAGRYAPGERLTEQQIAAQFQSSRTPVREAMRQLVANGFVVFKPNSGTHVRQWSAEQIREIFDLRVLIESEIAGHAATRISADDIGVLLQLQDEIEAGPTDTGEENTARISRLNRQFHRVIAQASQNERLIAMLSNAIEAPIVQQTFKRYTPRQLSRSFSHHRELIDALIARDQAWARCVMASHIHSAKNSMLESSPHDFLPA